MSDEVSDDYLPIAIAFDIFIEEMNLQGMPRNPLAMQAFRVCFFAGAVSMWEARKSELLSAAVDKEMYAHVSQTRGSLNG